MRRPHGAAEAGRLPSTEVICEKGRHENCIHAKLAERRAKAVKKA